MANESAEAAVTRQLRLGFLPMIPWASISSDTEKAAGGILGHVFNVLSKDLRFEYETVVPADNEWGRELSNGTWTGLVGMVKREEIDIIMGPFVPDEERMAGMEISPVYHSSTFVLLASAGRAQPGSIFGFFLTFDSEIWICMFVAMFLMMTLSSVGDYLRAKMFLKAPLPYSRFFSHYLWMYLATLFYEGTDRSPTRSVNRMNFGLWLILMMILMNAFSGQLKAVLMVQVDDSVIHSVKDLAEHPEIVPDSSFGDYYGVWSNALSWKSKGKESIIHPFAFAKPDIYQMVKDGEAVAVIDPAVVRMALSYFCTQLPGHRNFYLVEQVCSGYHLAFAASPKMDKIFLKKLFRKVRYMLEGSLFSRWLSQTSRNYWKCELQDTSQEDQAMEMKHLRSIFYLMLTFHGIALSVFVFEIVISGNFFKKI